MSRIFKKNPKLNELRDLIKEYAETIRNTRNEANTKKGMEKHALKMDAKYTGSHHARHHLLAYGLLRGKTREQIEARAEGVEPKTAVDEWYLMNLMKKYEAPEVVVVAEAPALAVAVG